MPDEKALEAAGDAYVMVGQDEHALNEDALAAACRAYAAALPSPAPTEPSEDELRDLAVRISEIHPPTTGKWVAEHCPVWIEQIVELLARAWAGRSAPKEPTEVEIDSWDEVEGCMQRVADGGDNLPFTHVTAVCYVEDCRACRVLLYRAIKETP